MNSNQLKTLIVDDDPLTTIFLKRITESLGHKVIGLCDNGKSAIKIIVQEKPDVVFMDINIKGSINGINVIKKIGCSCNASIIYISGYDEGKIVDEALATNPSNYIVKPINENDVKIALTLAEQKSILIEQLQKEKNKLEDFIDKDHLTKVYSRKKMDDDLQKFIDCTQIKNLTAIFIDADRFKGINDTFGHDTGDQVLIYLGQKLKKYAKILDGKVYRYGGEEFILLCSQNDNLLQELTNLKEDIKSQKIPNTKRDVSVTVSMGVAHFSECKSIKKMIDLADERVYMAKGKGRDRIEWE